MNTEDLKLQDKQRLAETTALTRLLQRLGGECTGYKLRMNAAQVAGLRAVLAQIEAASTLILNFDLAVKDITTTRSARRLLRLRQ